MISFEKKVEETYDKELRDKISLREEVKKLYDLNTRISDEANNLTKALKGDVKKQGNWGEVVLERILERSGLTKGQEYDREVAMKNDNGQSIRPDVIIRLPEEKHIIVDSKVSLVAYDQFVNSEEKEEKAGFLKEHLISVRSHIKLLSEKNYQTGANLNSPDFVLLFMPIEPAFSIAMQQDKEVYQYAWSRNIVIVSPTTLLATIKTIASIWKQEKQNRNTMEIARQAGALYDKFVGFLEDMDKIERGISQIDNAYKGAFNKLKSGTGNLIKRTESIRELGVKTSKKIPEKFIEE